jgi:tetratricopeptide (TPR) repeat protein
MIRRIALSFALVAGLVYGQAAQPKPKSQKELEALQAIFNAQDPDVRITAVENLLTKFADTEFKAVVLQVAAASAQQKNDFEKMTVYSERTLEADPKNYGAMLMLASGIAQRTREFDLDKEEKLSKAEKYANTSIGLIKDAPKPRPDLADAEWEAAKKSYLAQAYESLGLAAMARKKYDDAAKQFETAITTSPDGSTYVRLASAYNQAKKPDQAIATLDKLNGVADVHPAIKQAAAQERNNAVKLKGGAGAATSPAAPAGTPAPGAPASGTPTPATPSSPSPSTPAAPATSPAK